MHLISSAFENGQRIPRRHTGEGEDMSPPLAWRGAPRGTKSFALICEDPDAPGGTFRHWAAYDIAPDQARLPEACPRHASTGDLKQAFNDFGRTGYGGPMPPHGHGPHHYRFRLIALDTDHLGLDKEASVRDVEKAALAHMLADAALVGLYER